MKSFCSPLSAFQWRQSTWTTSPAYSHPVPPLQVRPTSSSSSFCPFHPCHHPSIITDVSVKLPGIRSFSNFLVLPPLWQQLQSTAEAGRITHQPHLQTHVSHHSQTLQDFTHPLNPNLKKTNTDYRKTLLRRSEEKNWRSSKEDTPQIYFKTTMSDFVSGLLRNIIHIKLNNYSSECMTLMWSFFGFCRVLFSLSVSAGSSGSSTAVFIKWMTFSLFRVWFAVIHAQVICFVTLFCCSFGFVMLKLIQCLPPSLVS